MTRLRIRNWAKHQHYKDRNPPWIKLHFELLASKDWVMLDDASRVLAVASMLLASRSETPGEIDADPDYFQRVAYLNSAPDFNPLIECGFLEVLADASKTVQTVQFVRPETETETETEREETRKHNGVKSCFAPKDWTPNPIQQRMARIAPGVDTAFELTQFRLHEFSQPKSDWDAAWVAWLNRARPAPDAAKKTRVTAEQSQHPALVYEREQEKERRRIEASRTGSGPRKIGDML